MFQCALLFRYSFLPIRAFLADPSKVKALKMKMASYWHMLGFLFFVFSKVIYEGNPSLHVLTA